ncbi:MAG: nuclear transport factor 2 family protein [Acidimicrobiales bacterium]
MAVVRREELTRWLRGYERAWRSAGADSLTELFTPDVSYSASPWREPVEGLADLSGFWEAERDGPEESFSMDSEVVALDNETAVVRVSVEYREPPRRWRNLWVLRFAAGGRCAHFEEWPFAPEQPDGH